MDSSEQTALAHIKFRGHHDIQYEPDGNVTPDFLVDGKVAVEVRRLNENERDSIGRPIGLEEVEIPFVKLLQHLFRSCEVATSSRWWVDVSFRRPLPLKDELKKQVSTLLTTVLTRVVDVPITHRIGNVELHFVPRMSIEEDVFSLRTIDDDDSGGWVIEELARNLKLCLEHKTQKTTNHRYKYSQWWLILLDHISYGLSLHTQHIFLDINDIIPVEWNRATIVNPLDHTRYFDLRTGGQLSIPNVI
jgi:hypothetical protein